MVETYPQEVCCRTIYSPGSARAQARRVGTSCRQRPVCLPVAYDGQSSCTLPRSENTIEVFGSLHPEANRQLVAKASAAARAWNELRLQPASARLKLARYIAVISTNTWNRKTKPYVPDLPDPPSVFSSPVLSAKTFSATSTPRTPRSPVFVSSSSSLHGRAPLSERDRSLSASRSRSRSRSFDTSSTSAGASSSPPFAFTPTFNAGGGYHGPAPSASEGQSGIVVHPSLYARPVFLALAIELLPTPFTLIEAAPRSSVRLWRSPLRHPIRATKAVWNLYWPYFTLVARLHLALLRERLLGPHAAEDGIGNNPDAISGGFVHVQDEHNLDSPNSHERDRYADFDSHPFTTVSRLLIYELHRPEDEPSPRVLHNIGPGQGNGWPQFRDGARLLLRALVKDDWRTREMRRLEGRVRDALVEALARWREEMQIVRASKQARKDKIREKLEARNRAVNRKLLGAWIDEAA